MVQVPPGELRRRDAARHRIEKPKKPLGQRPPALEDRVVHDLVQQHGEVEDRDALNDGQQANTEPENPVTNQMNRLAAAFGGLRVENGGQNR